MSANSFFPVLLMAQLRTRALQSALWKRLSETDLGLYLDALRYRFDVSGELERSPPTMLSQHYLEDLLAGVELPLNGFFPRLHEAVMDGLTGDPRAALAATGLARAEPAALNYKLHAQEPGQDKITIAQPTFPGILRGVKSRLGALPDRQRPSSRDDAASRYGARCGPPSAFNGRSNMAR